jgi:predicted nucleic acid-binding protein
VAQVLPQVPRTLYARAVLIDSGAFIALANPVDEHYEEATACLEEIVQRRLPVVVPMPVVFESYRRILHVVGRPAALNFLAWVRPATSSGAARTTRRMPGR